jgi:hypothetical protein
MNAAPFLLKGWNLFNANQNMKDIRIGRRILQRGVWQTSKNRRAIARRQTSGKTSQYFPPNKKKPLPDGI